MVKIVTFFLIGIIILALTGKLSLLKIKRMRPLGKKCVACGGVLTKFESCGCDNKI